MNPKRVVVTGFGAITALGNDWNSVGAALRARRTATRRMPAWSEFDGLLTQLGAPVPDFEKPAHYTRKQTRSMGRVALMATRASEMALENAGLLGSDEVRDGSMGIAYGSCSGSSDAMVNFSKMLLNKNTRTIGATTYVELMSHTAAVNIGVFFGMRGRIIPTASACTSGSQGVGYAYEAIRFGRQKLMLAGGGEELCPSQAAVFDTLYATSQMNDNPELAPRPFDRDRDGLVIGEGACTLVLEELEHAQARGATIYAEIVGFACNSDGQHITQPSSDTMRVVMQQALDDAGVPASAIGYVNAHGTATEQGDIAETQAANAVYGSKMPISSLKSYFGHSLGACGAIEAWLTIEMMNRGWYAPTVNLENIDPRCGELDYLTGSGREFDSEYTVSNNFAFGGINTSLVFRRWSN